tara:strand:- start:49 stop:957 length:909 start_codon:yes stop_codon:yes gene_type:complete
MVNLAEQNLSGYNRDAVLEATGGELKGKGFRAVKRASKKQNRVNARAKRIASRKGDQLRSGYEGYSSDKESQKLGRYFSDLQTSRNDRVATTTGKVLAAAGVTLATAGLGSAIAGNIATYGVLGNAGAAAAAAAGGTAAAGGAAATGLLAGTGSTIGLGVGGTSAATGLAGTGTLIGSAASGTAGLAGMSAGTAAAVGAGTSAAATGASFLPKAIQGAKKAKQVVDTVGQVVDTGKQVAQMFQQPEPTTDMNQIAPQQQVGFSPQVYQQYGMNQNAGNTVLSGGPQYEQPQGNAYYSNSYYP